MLAAGLRKLGFALRSDAFFDTVTVEVGARQDDIVARALNEKINLRSVKTRSVTARSASLLTRLRR